MNSFWLHTLVLILYDTLFFLGIALLSAVPAGTSFFVFFADVNKCNGLIYSFTLFCFSLYMASYLAILTSNFFKYTWTLQQQQQTRKYNMHKKQNKTHSFQFQKIHESSQNIFYVPKNVLNTKLKDCINIT